MILTNFQFRFWAPLLVAFALLAVLTRASAAPQSDFAVTFQVAGNGVATRQPDKASYAYGETLTLQAVADPGWIFIGWRGDIGQQDWWDEQYDYRLPITVSSTDYARFDKPADIRLNFTRLLADLGVSAPFEPASLRLQEVAAGQILDPNVPFQFEPAADFDPGSNAAGILTFMMLGTTVARTARTYMLYFDIQGKAFTPANIAPLVSVTDGVLDEGWSSLRIETQLGASETTYSYHKSGGGFSSVDDADGRDWVGFSSAPKSAGDFRGIPNMVPPARGGYFHPGRDTASTVLLSHGPLKVTFSSTAGDGAWQTTWSVYPTYATMYVEKASGNYWFLYEGAPGGMLDPAKDFVVRFGGVDSPAFSSWEGDLNGEEWVYFADPDLDRALFMAHHDDDSQVDSYRFQQDDQADELSAMTVFGFGRKLTTTNSFLTGAARQLTFGLLEGTDFDGNQALIRSAVQPLLISRGPTQERLAESEITTNPFDLSVSGDHEIAAIFAPTGYQLMVDIIGQGTVMKDPDQLTYLPGDSVSLEAIPDSGWRFSGWSDGLGTNPQASVIMSADRSLTATFAPVGYELTLNTIGSGTVTKEPDQSTYLHGQTVALQAVPDLGWVFSGWSDSLGENPRIDLVIGGAQTVTATFTEQKTRAYAPLVIR